MVYKMVKGLVQYSLDKGLASEMDAIYVKSQILDVMGIDECKEPQGPVENGDLEAILKELLGCAADTDTFKEDSVVCWDLLDTKLMNYLILRPGEMVKEFWKRYEESPERAVDWCYGLSQDSDYIHCYRIAKDVKQTTDTRHDTLDITISLSKSEKDPKTIAVAKLTKQSGYPKCQLYMGNAGYAGRTSHPTRNNRGAVPITISDNQWGFQYSPYMCYNEHCIVFNGQHVSMRIDKVAFRKLFDLIKQFPHYFLGPNADLPVVGGSILSRDHFQRGHCTLAMAKAPIKKHLTIKGYEDVEVGIVLRPMSVLRLRVADSDRLIELGDAALEAWRGYTGKDAFIFAETDGEPHNAITPIVRKVGDIFELDLMLRNNITAGEPPLDIYHPHQELHYIRKENIGLIEVMGLAVLSSRLKTELAMLGEYMTDGKDIRRDEVLEKHANWMEKFLPVCQEKNIPVTRDNVWSILREGVGKVFVRVLEDTGVYKYDGQGRRAFVRSLRSVGFEEV